MDGLCGKTARCLNLLSEGLSARAMTAHDVDIVTELVAACELVDVGRVLVDREDIKADWARPAFDLATESIGVFDRDGLIAEAEVFKGQRAEVNVLPADRGRGIGTALLGWTEQIGRDRGSKRIGQTIPDSDKAAAELLRRHGYVYGHTSWVLQIENDTRPAVTLPDGYVFRDYDPEADAREVFQVIEDAFNEWENREPSTFEDWAALGIERASFEPWQMLLVIEESGGELVGVAHLLESQREGWVGQVATKARHRRKGIARGLLQQSFAVFFDRGKTTVGLSTDSRTGALSLYEKVGMTVTRSYTNFAKATIQRRPSGTASR